jgi:hypothetical protein
MKRIFLIALALVSGICSAQTFNVNNLAVAGTSTHTGAATFSIRPTFNGNTPWDSGNFNPSSYATLASPAFTGVPIAPTAAAGTNTTQLATTAFAQTAASNPKTPLTVGTSLYPTIQAPISTTATTTNGSAVITVTSAAGLTVGMGVYGSFVPGGCNGNETVFQGTYIKAIAGTSVTMSCAAIATNASPVAVQFGQARYDTTSTLIANDIGTQTLKVGAAAQGNTASWLNQIATGQDYRLTNAAQIISPPGGGFGLTVASRSSDMTGGAVALPLQVLFYADTWTSNVGGWAMYLQSNLNAATAGSTQHLQIEQTIESAWPTVAEDPYTVNQINTTIGHRIDCGSGGALTDNNCSAAIDIVPNNQAFEAGIVIGNGAIDTGGGTRQGTAMSMPLMTGFTWYSASNTYSTAIWSPSAGINRMEAASTSGQHQFNVNGVEQFAIGNGFTYQKPVTFASISGLGCNAGNEGFAAAITDSTTATFGATVTGGGANHVAARCNGSNWVVY